jgi:succinylglutamate desuccinylase
LGTAFALCPDEMLTKTTIAVPNVKIEGEHLIGEFVDDADGPTLIVVGSLHGNEPSGMIALSEAARKLEQFSGQFRGRVYFLAGNSRALEQGARFIGADLNRHWTAGNIKKNRCPVPAGISEDHEQRELLKILSAILRTAKDEVYALDLHSTSAEGLPFATIGDTMRNRRFAQKFPVTVLLGIEEQLDGTLLEYLNNAGAVTLGFEGGQHESKSAIENHEALIWLALVNTGILAAESVPGLERYRAKLARTSGPIKLFEVRHREAISPVDEFEMAPGFENFDAIERGHILARNRDGFIRAVESGVILMPLYQKQGEDGFFIGREIAPFWLWLSSVLRRLRMADVVRILPGVWRHPRDPESLVVNTRVARVFPLQVFHLLGFRKRRWHKNELVVSRRRHDSVSPFKTRGK